MPPKEPQPNADQLLKHVPEYGVVICRACKFAIQPQALASHLLRHQIYRNERRQLLNRLTKLGLRDPEDVPIPPPDGPPLPYLPLHQGYICLSPECSHSCVSQKRMSQHWSEHHGEHDSKNVRARPAALQSFFRGNKIRYFEVSPSEQMTAPDTAGSVRSNSETSSPGFQQLVSPSTGDENESTVDSIPPLDMDLLRYFHHYVMTPSLIPYRGESESPHFWMETIPQHAFQHSFLMFSILGVSAVHLSSKSLDADTRQLHRSAGIQYHLAAMAAFRSAMEAPNTQSSTALIATARFVGIHRLMLQQIDYNDNQNASQETLRTWLPQVTEMLVMLRGGVDQLLRLQHILPHGSDFILSETDLDGVSDVHDVEALQRDVVSSMNIPAALFNRIDVLTEQLAATGCLQDANDFSAISLANTALVAGCARSYSSNAVSSIWNGLETFTQSVPEYFVRMTEAGQPAALVMYAHWFPLLHRLEPHYFFLQGQSERMLAIIRANLSLEYLPLVADIEYTV